MNPELADPSDYMDLDETPITYYLNGEHLAHWNIDADELHAEIVVLHHELRETDWPEQVLRDKALRLAHATEDLFAYFAAGGRLPDAWRPF